VILWDAAKAAANYRKHGIRFEEAALVFDDPFALSVQDRVEHGEPRRQTIGLVGGVILLLVAHTVELGEIEAILRRESGIDRVVAVGWPLTAGGPTGIEVFMEGMGLDVKELKKRLAVRLPEHMVPMQFHLLSKIPLNENGKYDRRALQKILENVQ